MPFGFLRRWTSNSSPTSTENDPSGTEDLPAPRPGISDEVLPTSLDHTENKKEPPDLSGDNNTVTRAAQTANFVADIDGRSLTGLAEQSVPGATPTLGCHSGMDEVATQYVRQSYPADSRVAVMRREHPSEDLSTFSGESVRSTIKTPTAGSTSRHALSSPTPSVGGPEGGHGRLPSPFMMVESTDPLRLWDAFVHKHRHYMEVLAKATQLRRQCLNLRLDLRSDPVLNKVSTPAYGEQNASTDPVDSHTNVSMLEDLELQLNQLDEQLLRDGESMLEAAPDILHVVGKRLPSMIARHQLDFRGDASTNSLASNADFEDDLDETAMELVARAREVSDVEDEILMLRHQRGRMEEVAHLGPETGSESSQQVQETLEELDAKIIVAMEKLKALRAEQERTRAITSTPDAELPREEPFSYATYEGMVEPDPGQIALPDSCILTTASVGDSIEIPSQTASTDDNIFDRPELPAPAQELSFKPDTEVIPGPPTISKAQTLVQEGSTDPEKVALEEQHHAARAG